MLRISKKADYALIAMKHLAGEARDGTATAREIAERYGVPPELLAKVLQQLARQGFLASHKGVHGGYHLVRSTSAISVADLIEAMDGPVRITACSSADKRCEQFSRCNVRDPLWRVKDRIVTTLRTFSLSDMAGDDDGGLPVKARIGARAARDRVEGRDDSDHRTRREAD